MSLNYQNINCIKTATKRLKKNIYHYLHKMLLSSVTIVTIQVALKENVFDPEGEFIAKMLQGSGHVGETGVKVAKTFSITFSQPPDRNEVQTILDMLSNPETHTIQVA